MPERDENGVLHVVALSGGTLKSVIEQERALPNFRMRFCTRRLKIEPYRQFLAEQSRAGPVVSYVGLRADEPGRAGGAYSDIDGVTMRFPLREWGWGEPQVQAALSAYGISCPVRTDCARCYHQRLGEWFLLWLDNRDVFGDAVADELRYGATYRTPGRDTFPTALKDLAAAFESGRVPETSLRRMGRESMAAGACRVCRM